jgi:pimeloyl-ACP methyl ester carboxylesterase
MTSSSRHIPTVIALHCSGASGRQWRGLAAMLSPRAHFIAPDLKAHHAGNSDGLPHTLMNEAAPIVGMIEASASPVHLVGHSYGGAVALRAALERPNHVASLTLYEPTAFSLLRSLGPAGRALHDDIAVLASRVSHQVSEGRHGEAMRGFYDYWQGEAHGTIVLRHEAHARRPRSRDPLGFQCAVHRCHAAATTAPALDPHPRDHGKELSGALTRHCRPHRARDSEGPQH